MVPSHLLPLQTPPHLPQLLLLAALALLIVINTDRAVVMLS
jgi:hypothetical protein